MDCPSREKRGATGRFRDLTSALDTTLRLRIVTLREMKRQQMIALRLSEMLGSVGRALLPVTAVLMTIVGLFATIGPARRGLRIQPTEALRAE